VGDRYSGKWRSRRRWSGWWGVTLVTRRVAVEREERQTEKPKLLWMCERKSSSGSSRSRSRSRSRRRSRRRFVHERAREELGEMTSRKL
jgi:hypothetical protein